MVRIGIITLDSGGRLEKFELMIETYGELNESGSNAILLCHAFSGNHHAAGKNKESEIGWWDEIVGPNKAIDTDKYYVVCCNNLGGCGGSSGPTTINPSSEKPYGKNFPQISVKDWVNSQKMLMDKIGVPYWHLVAGGSLGGMQALEWAISYPNDIKKAGIFAAASNSSTQNIALNEVARESIRKDQNFHDGDYLEHNVIPKSGLKTARMLGHMHLDFDLDLAKSDSKENIFYYIQYAHARIVSLEEKFVANYPSAGKDVKSIESNSYNECDKLIHEISRYPDVVKKSASSLQPHLIIYCLRDLSQLLHSYYNDNHVLSESEENMKAIVQCLSSVTICFNH